MKDSEFNSDVIMGADLNIVEGFHTASRSHDGDVEDRGNSKLGL